MTIRLLRTASWCFLTTLLALGGCHVACGEWKLVDAAARDTGTRDRLSHDLLSRDLASADLAPRDTPPSDSLSLRDLTLADQVSVPESGSVDVSAAEASAPSDSGGVDGQIAPTDAAGADTLRADTTMPDTTMPDTTGPDTTTPDAALPDTAEPDTADAAPPTCPCGEGCCEGQVCLTHPGDLYHCGDYNEPCRDCSVDFGSQVDSCLDGECACLSNDDSGPCSEGEVCDPGGIAGCCLQDTLCNGVCCMPGETCCPDERGCSIECDSASDGDGDGFPSIAAGGNDCDDTCATCYPGSVIFTAEEDALDQDCLSGADDPLVDPLWSCSEGGGSPLRHLAVHSACDLPCVERHCAEVCSGGSTCADKLRCWIEFRTTSFCTDHGVRCDGVLWCATELCDLLEDLECGSSGQPRIATCQCKGTYYR